MNMLQTPVTGSCLCGAIKYQVDKIEADMAHCHCSMCRKFHGAAYSTFGEALRDNFHWLQGEALLMSYTADNGSVRQFCKKCGSSMTFLASLKSTQVLEFSLGTMDQDIDQFPDAHVYVENKANWSDINDSLLHYQKHRIK
jgi:hypothetical protein